MPQITLTLKQCQQLVDFCHANKRDEYFIAKDDGAYLGCSTGPKPEQQCLFYFAGCDPKKDGDWYDTVRAKFGGDDFGELLPVAELEAYMGRVQKWVEAQEAKGMPFKSVAGFCWKVGKTTMRIDPVHGKVVVPGKSAARG